MSGTEIPSVKVNEVEEVTSTAVNFTLEESAQPKDPTGDQPAPRNSWAQTRRTLTIANLAVSGKVPLENKVGIVPEGWHAQFGYALQRGISDTNGPRMSGADRKGTYEQTEVGDMVVPSCVFEEIAFECFAEIRQAFKISPLQYISCLGLQETATKTSLRLISSSQAAGKSSAFFFLSADQRFMLKTMTKEDYRAIQRIKGKYLRHVKQYGHTLLPQYVAVYRMRLGTDPPVVILVMNNFFAGQARIDKRFDLKGSTFGRKANAKEISKGSKAVLKDLDFVSDGWTLPISNYKGDREYTIEQHLQTDAELLRKLGLIDYSLIVAYHIKDPKTPSVQVLKSQSHVRQKELMNVIAIETDDQLVYLGIVDILTRYSLRKRAETFFMGTLRCCADVSCQPPKKYSKRFVKFMLENST